jgi:hypothetical protein
VAKRGRPRKAGARDANDRLLRNVEPCERVQQRRELYAWLVPTKGPEGRGGSIDQDVCDGIGQLHALGLLDGHGFEAQDLRDKGREWRDHYCKLLRGHGFKTGSYERMDKSRGEQTYTARDERFDRVDEELRGLERSALLSLLVDPVVGSRPDGRDDVPWVNSHIAYALLEKKKLVPAYMQPVRFPDANDHELLKAAVRGLCLLVDGALPARFERRAA